MASELTIIPGVGYTLVVSYADAAGNPIPVNGWEARMEIRERPGSTVLIERSTDPSGGITVDGPAGEFTVAFTDAETAALDFGRLRMAQTDMVATPPSGESVQLLDRTDVVLKERITV